MIARQIASPLIRFLISGGLNTLGTYLLYLVLLRFMPYWVSYAIAFVSGIALAYALNRFFVFGAPRNEGKAALLPLVYLAQYGLGALIVYGWVDLLRLPPTLAPLASIAVTIPLTFVASRWLFR
ncbi:GtrA-like protein [Variovorax sp. PBL-H6]|uniref:GtrA family protein n=1 Tax=Variovorax sp. PBL-H6 TaxID=434009 RepID=UPI001315EE65|nr:GtrA family protein [Variovorax sp. PBL-H6]VTU17418.1 GtrA-like protein [Variovorax sp. PBL-H6]